MNKEIPGFTLTRGAVKAVELLNENIYNKIFVEGNNPADEIKLIYRIYFQLLNNKEISGIQDNKEFWKECSSYFLREGNGKTGIFIL